MNINALTIMVLMSTTHRLLKIWFLSVYSEFLNFALIICPRKGNYRLEHIKLSLGCLSESIIYYTYYL